MPTDSTENPIRKGEAIYLLTSTGEGYADVWFRGRKYSEDVSTDGIDLVAMLPDLHVEWWAQLRKTSGIVGWGRAENSFENQDACGSQPVDAPRKN